MRHTAIRLVAALVIVAVSLPATNTLVGAQSAPAEDTGSAAKAAPNPPTDTTRLALAGQLMDAMQVGPTVLQGIEIGIATQKAAHPKLPEAFWTEFAARARRDLPAFVDSMRPAYANRFSAQELREMIAFYHTPTGRHLAAQAGAIGVEVAHAAQRWGIELAADAMKALAAKGIMVQ